jgi:hypothetical protein
MILLAWYGRSAEWVARCDLRLWGLLKVWSHSLHTKGLSEDIVLLSSDVADLSGKDPYPERDVIDDDTVALVVGGDWELRMADVDVWFHFSALVDLLSSLDTMIGGNETTGLWGVGRCEVCDWAGFNCRSLAAASAEKAALARASIPWFILLSSLSNKEMEDEESFRMGSDTEEGEGRSNIGEAIKEKE